ncbi:SDR family oxidoreductase [Namhaeicola litoreus]|uniref:dTDP-4-dehydrorhamnose reductase n=1 Tax=Namhaeicola litoreus TaxID=1052145 RepID=A0ABW3Y4Y3_9FLAO
MKRILVTGSNGLLGQNLVKFLVKHRFEVIALSRGENKLKKYEGFNYIDVNLEEFEKIKELIENLKPNVIVHTAAMTNVDQCELEQKSCFTANVEVVENLVKCCQTNDIHLIHLSTDFIFDGIKGFYKEKDKPNPVNYYGLSKLKSEELILKSTIKYTILRTILVYGLTEELKSNIVFWVKNNLENGKDIHVVTDQYRMPTHVNDLVFACHEAIIREVCGVYHISSSELLSIFEVANLVADVFELDKKFIHPIQSCDLNLPAKRPEKTGFDLTLSIRELNFTPRTFLEGLQLFKNQLQN